MGLLAVALNWSLASAGTAYAEDQVQLAAGDSDPIGLFYWTIRESAR